MAGPSSLGRPDEVCLKEPPTGPTQDEVTLVYASSPDIAASRFTAVSVLVMEERGKFNEIFFQKTLGSGGTIAAVDDAGDGRYWITGHPNSFSFLHAGCPTS